MDGETEVRVLRSERAKLAKENKGLEDAARDVRSALAHLLGLVCWELLHYPSAMDVVSQIEQAYLATCELPPMPLPMKECPQMSPEWWREGERWEEEYNRRARGENALALEAFTKLLILLQGCVEGRVAYPKGRDALTIFLKAVITQ